jgi:hypothetical protein
MECTSRYSSCKIYFAGVICVKNPEPVDCAGAWSKWTNCSATCGGGTSTREYVVTTSPQHGGKECPVSACPDGWKSEGGDKCSAPVDGSNAGTCSKLSQFEGYTNTQKNDWAKACSTTWGAKETNTCAPDPCPVDCIGYWDGWSSCSVDCAIGTQTRSYNISRKEQHGGKHCPEKFKSQTKSCDTGVTCPPRNSKGMASSILTYLFVVAIFARGTMRTVGGHSQYASLTSSYVIRPAGEICKSVSPWPLSSGCRGSAGRGGPGDF